MPKDVSAITGEVTIRDGERRIAPKAFSIFERKRITGPVPLLPFDWSIAPSIGIPSQPTIVSGITERATEAVERVGRQAAVTEPIVQPRYEARTIQEARDIPEVVGVAGRSVQEAVKFTFPALRGKGYTQEELGSWSPGETIAEFEERIRRERALGTGVSLVLGAVPVGKVGQVGAKALPKIVGTGATARIFSRLFGGLGRGSIYEAPGVVTRGIQRVPIVTGGAARFLAERPLLRAGVGFAEGIIAPDIFAATTTAIVPKPKAKRTLTPELSTKISRKAFEEATTSLEYEKVVTDEGVEFKPKYPGIETPFGRISVASLIPAQQVLPGGMGEQFGKDFKASVVKQLTKEGWSKSDAKKQAEFLDVTQRQARGYGGAFGFLSIGIGEEALAQNLLRRGVIASGQITAKGLTKKEAAKVIEKAVGGPLLKAGFLGGTTSVITEQRMKEQELRPIEIGLGGLLGAVTAFGLGKPIATRAITSPVTSKILYGVGSIFDPFELPADIAESRIRRLIREPELRIPIKTPVITPSVTPTPSVIPGVTPIITPTVSPLITPTITKTPTVTVTPTVTPIVTPVPTELITPVSTTVITPSPVVPIETVTPTEAFTATPVITPSVSPTFTSTFVPTFTGDFIPFIPPIAGGEGFAPKKRRRERTRFIDEFTAAFAGLGRPGVPVVFGKRRPVDVLRKSFKPKKGKRRKSRGGVNVEALEALLF